MPSRKKLEQERKNEVSEGMFETQFFIIMEVDILKPKYRMNTDNEQTIKNFKNHRNI